MYDVSRLFWVGNHILLRKVASGYYLVAWVHGVSFFIHMATHIMMCAWFYAFHTVGLGNEASDVVRRGEIRLRRGGHTSNNNRLDRRE